MNALRTRPALPLAVVIASFHEKYIPEPNSGCWLWTASLGIGGYGRLYCGADVTRYAHRFSYELAFGPVPAGMFVLHRCDTAMCVNPDHLYIGTHLDNMRDMRERHRTRNGWMAGTRTRTERCARLHLFTPENTYIKPSGARLCKTCRRMSRLAWERRRAQAVTEAA